MAESAQTYIQEAVTALKTGRKADARRALDRAIELDERSEQAWLWMSGVVDTDSERQICLENVLTINPQNQKALKGLEELRTKSAPPPAPPKSVSPFFDVGTDSSASGWNDWAAASPTSVEWGPPASQSAPASDPYFSSSSPSDADYDQWMAGLSLGKTPSEQPVSPAPDAPPVSGGFENFDTGFDSGPFSSGPFADYADDSLSQNPYGGTSRESSSSGGRGNDFPAVADAAAPKTESDPFGLKRKSASSTNAKATNTATPGTDAPPASTFSFGKKKAEAPALAAARKAKGPTFDEYEGGTSESATAAPPRLPPTPAEPPITTSAPISSSTMASGPTGYYAGIPAELRGNQRIAPVLLLSLIGLVVLDVGSIVWLLSNLRH